PDAAGCGACGLAAGAEPTGRASGPIGPRPPAPVSGDVASPGTAAPSLARRVVSLSGSADADTSGPASASFSRGGAVASAPTAGATRASRYPPTASVSW